GLPIRRPGSGFRLSGGGKIVVRRSEQPAPLGPLPHLRPDLGRDEILPLPDLPAAAERAVDADEARRHGAERARQAVLPAEEGLLRGQDRRKVLPAPLVL